MVTYYQENHTSMVSLEIQLAEKITARQELESELEDTAYRLDHVKYEINQIKDKMISEYEYRLEEKLQQIEDLQEKNNN